MPEVLTTCVETMSRKQLRGDLRAAGGLPVAGPEPEPLPAAPASVAGGGGGPGPATASADGAVIDV